MHFSSFYEPDQLPGETNQGVSLTIPGQDMTVQEVLRRFVNGTLPPVNQNFIYEGRGDALEVDPVTQARDLTDLEEIQNASRMRLAERQTKQSQKSQAEEVGKQTSTSEEA